MMYTNVFKFNIMFEGCDDYQERFVIANTENEAIEKMDVYVNQLLKNGFALLHYSINPTVELFNVIV